MIKNTYTQGSKLLHNQCSEITDYSLNQIGVNVFNFIPSFEQYTQQAMLDKDTPHVRLIQNSKSYTLVRL